MRARRLVLLALAGWLWSRGAPAQSAQETRASALFEQGAAAYAKGDFVAAARAFEQVDSTLPNASAAYNAGIAWQEAGERARAATAYERALERGDLDATRTSDARRRLGELKKTLARLRIEAARGRVSVGHLRAVPVPVSVFVDPGSVLVELSEPGGNVREQRLTVAPGADENVRFADEPKEPARPGTEDAAPVATPENGQRTWGWVAIGAGVAASGAAVYLGSRALSARDEFDDSEHTDADARDRAESLRLWTNVAWGAALVAGGTGVVLLLTAPSTERSTALAIGPGSVGLRGRF